MPVEVSKEKEEKSGSEHALYLGTLEKIKKFSGVAKTSKFLKDNKKKLLKSALVSVPPALFFGLVIPPYLQYANQQQEIGQLKKDNEKIKGEMQELKSGLKEELKKSIDDAISPINKLLEKNNSSINNINKNVEKIQDDLRATMNSVRDNAVDISILGDDLQGTMNSVGDNMRDIDRNKEYAERLYHRVNEMPFKNKEQFIENVVDPLKEKIEELELEDWALMGEIKHNEESIYGLQAQLNRLRRRIKESIKTFEDTWGSSLKKASEFWSKLGDFEQELKQKIEPQVELMRGQVEEFGGKVGTAIKRINSFQKTLRKWNKKIEKFKKRCKCTKRPPR